LKYPSPAVSLSHLDKFVSYLKEQKNMGIWFMDSQSRGAPFFWLLVSKYVPKDELAKTWYEIVGSNDPSHLKVGASVSGFYYDRGSDQFLEKIISPGTKNPDFRYGVFGNWKVKFLTWF
jgi:hypothetical protein